MKTLPNQLVYNALKHSLCLLLIVSLPEISFGQKTCLKPTSGISSKTHDFTSGKSPEISSGASKSSDLILVDKAILSNEKALKSLKDLKSPLCLVVDHSKKSSKLLTQILLEAPVKEYKVLAVIPENGDAISKVFSPKLVTDDALKQMNRVGKQFDGLKNTTVIRNAEDGSILSVIEKQLKNSPGNDLFIIVGHNKNGRIYFPDGSNLTIKELNNKLSKGKNKALILSCETISSAESISNGIVTSRRLEFDEIGKALKVLENKLPNYKKANMSDVLIELGSTLDNSTTNMTKTKLVVSAIGGGTIIAYMLTLTDEK